MIGRRAQAAALSVRLAALLLPSLLAPAAVAQDEKTPPPPLAEPSLAEQAGAAERAGDLGHAGELWAKHAEQHPDDAAAWLHAANDLIAAQRYTDALDVLDRARKHHPDDADLAVAVAKACNLQAESLLAKGIRDTSVTWQFDEAARVAEAALRSHPDNRDLRLLLAQSRYQLGDMDAASAAAEEAVRRFPSHPGGHMLLGKIAFQEFVGLQRRIQQEKPTGKALDDLQQMADDARQRAHDAYQRAVQLDPQRAFAHAQLGDLQAWQDDVEHALRHYGDALAIDPGVALDHHWLAQHSTPEQRVKLYTDAAASYRARDGASPAKAAVLDWWHAYALFEARQFHDAWPLFEQAVAADPDYVNSHGYAMLAAYWDGNQDEAEHEAARYGEAAAANFADFVRQNAQRDEVVAILEFLAQRAYDAGRLQASRPISHVLAMVVDDEQHWNNYAFLCSETGAYEESFAAYRDALSIAPDSPQLLNDAAVVLQYHLPTDENLKKAKEMYDHAIVAADRILKDAGASDEEHTRARQARANAKSNLAKLKH